MCTCTWNVFFSFYTAGARLIGLNDRQLEQELKRLQKASKNQDSPYAKLPFMTTQRDKPKQKKRRVRRKHKRQSHADTSADTGLGLPTPPPNLELLAESAGSEDEHAEEEKEPERKEEEDNCDDEEISMAESAELMAVYRGRNRDRRDNIMADADAMSVINVSNLSIYQSAVLNSEY